MKHILIPVKPKHDKEFNNLSLSVSHFKTPKGNYINVTIHPAIKYSEDRILFGMLFADYVRLDDMPRLNKKKLEVVEQQIKTAIDNKNLDALPEQLKNGILNNHLGYVIDW